METQKLADKEINIISEIQKNPLVDQRTIAQNVGLSLGLTNLIIKKLAKTGYIKIRQLNKKKLQYILTPEGFAEKAKKSYNYTLKTIKLFKEIKSKIQQLILDFQQQGVKKFIIIGNNELTDIVEFAFKTFPEIKNLEYLVIKENPSINKLKKEENTAIFYTETKNSIKPKQENKNNFVYLLDFLAESGIFL